MIVFEILILLIIFGFWFYVAYKKDVKPENTFDDSSYKLDNLNPFEVISGEIVPNHVEQFIKERSSQDLQKFWQDEIKLNGGK